MATSLNKQNKAAVFADIKKKGFRTKFWREYRSSACKGSGVGKYMDLLEKLGVAPSGDPSKANLDKMGEIVQAFSMLSNAMIKARGKCGKLQAESREMTVVYNEIIKKREDEAAKLARNADKIRHEEMKRQLALEKENEETDKHLAKLKKEHEQKKKLVQKEFKALDSRAAKIQSACEDISKDTRTAGLESEKLLQLLSQQRRKEGVDERAVEEKIDKALRALPKKHKLDVHQKNIDTALPKLMKEAGALFQQYATVEEVKKERTAVGNSLMAMRRAFDEARDELKLFDSALKQALTLVQKSRPEGV